MLSKITVSPAPHISQKLSTRQVMLDVIIGLLPAVIASIIFFHEKAAIVIAVTVGSCVISEWACNKFRKKPNSLGDLSAVLTGLILALSLPPAIPLEVAAIGGAFAIVIGKMLYGGLGSNVFNPAMAARAFLTVSFGLAMTTWTAPATLGEEGLQVMKADNTVATSQATPLQWSKMAIKEQEDAITEANYQIKVAFFGNVGGCLGETSSLALLIGAAWLFYRKGITWHIPTAVLVSALVFSGIAWLINPDKYVNPALHIFGGGMLICAFFIATDPVTAPLTTKGMWIFGAGVGLLVMLIRIVGGYPEGVMFAVLIMNAFTPLIDRYCRVVPAGGIPGGKK